MDFYFGLLQTLLVGCVLYLGALAIVARRAAVPLPETVLTSPEH